MRWKIDEGKNAKLTFNLQSPKALIKSLLLETGNVKKTVLLDANPEFQLFIGTRRPKKNAKWMVFFDNPDTRPYTNGSLKLEIKTVDVVKKSQRATVKFGDFSFKDFSGQLWFTVYSGSPLVHVEAVIQTESDSRAILYGAGISLPDDAISNVDYYRADGGFQKISVDKIAGYSKWKHTRVSWKQAKGNSKFEGDKSPIYNDSQKGFLKTKYRAVGAELKKGSLTVFPPPHKFLYPLDYAENLGANYAWKRNGRIEIGMRQPPLGDGRFRPWVNAPPQTNQHLDLFFLVSADGGEASLKEAKRYTHNDCFPVLPGYKRFTSHYHFWHTRSLINAQKRLGTEDIPEVFKAPPFISKMKQAGIDIIHLAEFHGGPRTKSRLFELQKLHSECARLSDKELLVLPGEEPNCFLGGHWISFFPRPVNWIFRQHELVAKELGIDPKKIPFVYKSSEGNPVYFIKSAADVLKLMEAEDGLMWTAHARIKGSTGYPDNYRHAEFYKSPHYLGAAWKQMPADYSHDRLGRRVLNLLDDMNNWGQPKRILGEADLFELNAESELYGHLNVNYLKLDKLPLFEDGWDSITNALRKGRYFTSTGEVLIPSLRTNGEEFAAIAKTDSEGRIKIEADLKWTYPLSFAEIISSDGIKIYRERIDLSWTGDFGSETISHTFKPKPGTKWFRFEVWDIAENGAFTQPVYLPFKDTVNSTVTPLPATFCRLVPERSDDFAWENDKVAFRAYGPALRNSKENSGIDCWLKRVDYPVINKWYKENTAGKSYHKDHGEGYDPYKVGDSRGCGGTALWIDGKMITANVFTKSKILKSNRDESVFELTYEWEHEGDQYQEVKRISIKLGERLFKSVSTFRKNGKTAKNLPIAIGLVKQSVSSKVVKNQNKGWIALWEKFGGTELGTGILIASDRISKIEDQPGSGKKPGHGLIITRTDKNGQVQFYAGYGWKKAGEINSFDNWISYLNSYKRQP